MRSSTFPVWYICVRFLLARAEVLSVQTVEQGHCGALTNGTLALIRGSPGSSLAHSSGCVVGKGIATIGFPEDKLKEPRDGRASSSIAGGEGSP